MWLGVDLGTSGVKVVLTDAGGAVVSQAKAPLTVSHPHPLWSEQDPEAWWQALDQAMAELRRAADLTAIGGIGLTGQMHGAVLIDDARQVLRPAILWNDGRSMAECRALDALARRHAGNLAMPGFTAPKLLWVRAHEPEVFAAVAKVLPPKDWLRYRLTGEFISEMSDAAGTLWLDVARRRWSPELLAATHLNEAQMPALVEGNQEAGRLRSDVAARWGLPPGCLVAGGAGDNAAGAVGIGCVHPGEAFVSLGTSGVLFVSDDRFLPDPDRAVHAFCHCLPATWHRMAVILSAAGSLAWFAQAMGKSEAALLSELEQAGVAPAGDGPLFLPYLAGERTPHNDSEAMGLFFGLTAANTRADLTRAVLEGVAFALADGLDALEAKGGRIARLSVVGGGARSALWGRLLAAALQRPLTYHAGGEIGPALGAARLARLAAGAGSIDEVCVSPTVAHVQEPEPELAECLAHRRPIYRRLYLELKAAFAARRKIAD
jgi:xylulokinase